MAVIDGGIDFNVIDLGGPGYPSTKVPGGYDYYYHDGRVPIDDWVWGHGTKVAGIIGALTNNAEGIAGIAGGWQRDATDVGVSLYAIKVMNQYGYIALMPVFTRAIQEAADPDIFGCHILNLSIYGPGYEETERAAVNFAYKVRASFMACKGNDGDNTRPMYPADYDYSWITAVGGYDQNGIACAGENCDYSNNYGFGIDLLAPGRNIPSTAHGGYAEFSGTSVACPHATGSAALIKSIMPNLQNEDIDWMLKYSAFDPPAPESDSNVWTWNERYGHGDLRVSTVIERLGSPGNLLTGDARGGESIAHTPDLGFDFYGSPLNGHYTVTMHEVHLDVTYPQVCVSIPFVWVVGDSTIGWSASNHNYQDGWGQVIPGTARRLGCQMRTYVYEVFDSQHNFHGRYPCQPEEVNLHYRTWCVKDAEQPNRGGPKIYADFDDDNPLQCSAFPNPFNSSSQIMIKIGNDSKVNIEMYDILGRQVRILMDALLSAGQYSVIWDSKNNAGNYCPSGIYYCAVKTEQKSSILRLVLVK